jgi:hypothetical protein
VRSREELRRQEQKLAKLRQRLALVSNWPESLRKTDAVLSANRLIEAKILDVEAARERSKIQEQDYRPWRPAPHYIDDSL